MGQGVAFADIPPWLGSPGQRPSLRFNPEPEGWRVQGRASYTCICPPGGFVDKDLWRRIHEFDPGLIPIWERQWWISPDGVEVLIVFMGGARRMNLGRSIVLPMHVECPPNFKPPNLLELVFRHNADPRIGGPGTPMQADEIFAYLRRNFIKPVDDRRRVRDEETIKRHAEEDAAAERRREEAEYKWKHVERRVTRKLAQVSDVEWKEHQGKQERNRKLKEMGLRPEKENKKIFIDLGG